MRRIWKRNGVDASSPRDRPMTMPNGNPQSRATSRPTVTRRRLAMMCGYRVPLPSNSARACAVRSGENDTVITLECSIGEVQSHHTASPTLTPASGCAMLLACERRAVRADLGSNDVLALLISESLRFL
jgi:hypothetical protein